MRFVVLLFGFVGVLMTGFMGIMMFFASEFVALLRSLNNAHVDTAVDFFVEHTQQIKYEDTGIFLAVAALYGLLGTILAFGRYGWQGALMLLLPVLFTGLMNPFSLAFSSVQALAALLSFFVFPVPLEASSEADEEADDEEDAEEEEEKPKPKSKPKQKPKRKSDDDDDD